MLGSSSWASARLSQRTSASSSGAALQIRTVWDILEESAYIVRRVPLPLRWRSPTVSTRTYKGADTSGPPRPRRKRHIFAWTVLALQVVFIIWLVIGASIGAALVVIIWVAADALAGVTFVVARLARDWRNDLP